MGAVEIHPSQRRVSCEICRKHKSRCRRLHVNDLRCAQCVLLGVKCTPGLQNKVGRPRGALASDDKSSKQPPNKSVSTVNTAYTTPAVGKHNQAKSPGRSPEASPLLGGNQLDWCSVMSPAVTGEPVLVTTASNSLDTAPAWPTMGMDFLGQASLPGDITNDFDHMFPPPDTDLNPSFTILPYYALDTTVTTSSPSGRTYPAAVEIWAPSRQGRIAGDVPVASDALVKLSKLNLDLHTRMAAVEMNKSILDLDSFIYQSGVLHIDDTTLAEFMLKTSQEFLQILTQLLSSQSTPSHLRALRTTDTTFPNPQSLSSYHDNHYLSPSPSPSSSAGSSDVSKPPLLAPIALIITSVFIQLISLYELTLEHLTTRIERIAMNPIRPIPNLSSGGLPVVEPCIQGMLFSEVVVHLLERIERLLGIGAVHASGDVGLLSARQRDVLWGELSGSLSVLLPSHGVMRPANVRNTFKKVAVILKQISIDELNW
ncbi:hypothetical protein V501_00333 [Pseudogymnoascus sp. VKM F-4519 (FW-2642)]|nr:hypothetical protein V501_00333 [Pseudogymnoascus sp. VKM F-4519 (FW-2642)]